MQSIKNLEKTLQNALTLCEVRCIIITNNAICEVCGGETMVNNPKMARIKANLSLESAAKKLGISAGYLSQIENGQRQVSKERASQIAELYKVKREEIFLPLRYSVREVSA